MSEAGSSRLQAGMCSSASDMCCQSGSGGAYQQRLVLSPIPNIRSKLSDSLHDMHALQSLTIVGCTQLNTLSLRSHSLRRISLRGTRALTELELRCPVVEEVAITPLAPGLAAAASLRRIVLASHAATRLAWAGFPALREVVLSCPALDELDLSECSQLRDDVFDSLGPGPGGWVGGPDAPPACPRLRLLKLAECDGLRVARLASPSLERLVMGQCRGVASVELDCPRLAGLALEECTSLEDARLRLAAMTVRGARGGEGRGGREVPPRGGREVPSGLACWVLPPLARLGRRAPQRPPRPSCQSMSLGTCPRLSSISLDSPAMASLDLRGCNELSCLALACPLLRRVDATFCSGLGDAALAALAGCPALEELVLAVCSSVSGAGLAALADARRLARLDLSYNTRLEDPRPLAAACPGLTSLALSSDYRLDPQLLLELFPPPPAPRALPALRELDASYCGALPGALAALVLRGGAQLHTLFINGCREGARDALWPLLHSGPLPPGPAANALLAPLRGGGGALAPSDPQLPGTSALRCLSMVGSKQLRHFRLGLAPAAEAVAAGLLPVDGGKDAAGVDIGGARHVALATPLAGLAELRLSISAVHSLMLGLPALHELQLNKCEELAHLVLASPSLARLSLQACRLLPEALVRVVAGLPALEVLDLQYAPPEVSTAAMEAALRAACPSLREVLFTKAPGPLNARSSVKY